MHGIRFVLRVRDKKKTDEFEYLIITIINDTSTRDV